MQLLTLPKLAARSGWPESRVRRMVARGLLSHIRVNGRLLLPETAIEDYVATTSWPPQVGQPRWGDSPWPVRRKTLILETDQ